MTSLTGVVLPLLSSCWRESSTYLTFPIWCSSWESIGMSFASLSRSLYGEIEADVYLRRFFDMEFILPEVGAEQFSRHLIRKFELTEFFASLSKSANRKIHSEDFSMLEKYFPELWSRLGLRLRDIDYCVRLIALAGRSMTPGNAMYPWLLGLLVTLQFKNPTLYTRYIQGDCRGSAIMDYLDALLPPRDEDYARISAND